MGLNLHYYPGQTPLDEEESEGLLIPTIATRGELDEFEQQNIEEAFQWIMNHSLKAEQVFSDAFICTLHKRMYGQVWAWAGKFRKTNKNLGIDRSQIPLALKTLLDDALFWINNTTYTPHEIALRFKHRLVSIHCFANGNGRHSRLMADIIIEKVFRQAPFTWGTAHPEKHKDIRASYLKAIRTADKGNIHPLMAFAVS